jgi:hypothetical protein
MFNHPTKLKGLVGEQAKNDWRTMKRLFACIPIAFPDTAEVLDFLSESPPPTTPQYAAANGEVYFFLLYLTEGEAQDTVLANPSDARTALHALEEAIFPKTLGTLAKAVKKLVCFEMVITASPMTLVQTFNAAISEIEAMGCPIPTILRTALLVCGLRHEKYSQLRSQLCMTPIGQVQAAQVTTMTMNFYVDLIDG